MSVVDYRVFRDFAPVKIGHGRMTKFVEECYRDEGQIVEQEAFDRAFARGAGH